MTKSKPHEARHPKLDDTGFQGADTVRFLDEENHKIIFIWAQETKVHDISEWFKIAHSKGGYVISTTTTLRPPSGARKSIRRIFNINISILI